MTRPILDPETDVDLDFDAPGYDPPVAHTGGTLDAVSDVGEWDTTPVAAGPARPAVPRPARPGQAEVTAQYDARAEQTRAGRRRRRVTGVALTTLIVAAAAASAVGWPVVLAGLAAAGGTAGVGAAAVRGTRNANGGGRGRRNGQGPGRAQTGGGQRRPVGGGRSTGGRTGGGGTGGGGGRRRTGAAGGGRGAGLGSLNPFKGGTGRKASAQKSSAQKKTAPGTGAARTATSGARSGPATGRKPTAGAHRAGGANSGGLFKKLTGGSRGRGAAGRGGSGGARSSGNGHRGAPLRRPVARHTTRRGGPTTAGGRNPRTVGGAARQAKRQAVRQARQNLGRQIGQHNANARLQPARRRFAARQQAAQAAWARKAARQQARAQHRQARLTARNVARIAAQQAGRTRRDARRAARRTARQAEARRHRRYWRRRGLVAANRIRRRTRAGLRRLSPLTGLGRRAQLLARLRQLNPTLGTRGPRTRPRWYRRAGTATWRRLTGLSRSGWDATLGRLFVTIRRALVAAAARHSLDFAQMWADFYRHLARHRTPRAVPVPARPGPTAPFRGMTPAQRAAVAAALGMAAGASRQTRPDPRRRPARPTPSATRPRPSTRTPRPTMAVPIRPAVRTPRGTPPMDQAVQNDAQSITHPAWEAALSALHDSVATYEIPDDGTGVLDVDAFIASIGGFMHGLSGVLDQVGAYLAEGPTNTVVVEQLSEFATAISAMGGDAAQVYEMWRTNEDNAHDLRRAEGEINRAELFNVGG